MRNRIIISCFVDFFQEFLTMQVYHGWSSSIYLVPIAVFSVLYNIPKFLELEVSFSLEFYLPVERLDQGADPPPSH
jgi:hypothetical protein